MADPEAKKAAEAAAAPVAPGNDGDVVVLTEGNVNELLGDGGEWFVEIYAPWW